MLASKRPISASAIAQKGHLLQFVYVTRGKEIPKASPIFIIAKEQALQEFLLIKLILAILTREDYVSNLYKLIDVHDELRDR